MATNVSVDSILDALVTQLSTLMPALGGACTADRPFRTVQRYTGAEFKADQGLRRGIAGRCPAVRVMWAGTRNVRTTIGRRVDRVESAFRVIVASDNQHSRDFRKTLLPLVESVRKAVGSRAFGLAITPARYRSTSTLIDEDALMAVALTFTVLHRVDYCFPSGTDTVVDASGSIVNAAVAHTSLPSAPSVTPQGALGTTLWGYAVVGIDAAGLRTLISPTGSTATGAAVLSAVDFNRVAWAAKAGCVAYEVERVTAGGTPSTTGKIVATTGLTIDDTGLAVLGVTAPDSLHVDLHEVFP